MKKFLSLLLIGSLVLSLAACGKNHDSSAETTTAVSTVASSADSLENIDPAATLVMTIADHKIMVPEYNFYYMTQYNQFMQTYGNYVSMLGLDVTKPFDEQECTMTEDSSISTWHDYFANSAEKQIVYTMAYYDQAQKENMQLDEASKTAIQSHLDGIAPYAQENGMTEEEYFTSCYGKGMTKEVYTEIINRYYLAVQWQTEQNELSAQKIRTDAEIEQYYNDHKDQFASVDYRIFTFASKATYAEDETDEQRAQYLEQAKADAKAMADKVKSEKDFISLAQKNASDAEKETYEDASATFRTYSGVSENDDTLGQWLYDSARKANDVTTIEDSTGTSVVMLVKPAYKDETLCVDVRHILVMTQIEGDTATDEEKAAAKAKAQEIYDAWKAGDGTEESFAAFAKEKSEDPGSKDNGGLYQNVKPGDMVQQFNDWCFDSQRKSGDTGIVETSYGAHIMYFSATGDAVWKINVREAMSTNELNTLFNSVCKDYTTEKDAMGMNAVKKVINSIEKA